MVTRYYNRNQYGTIRLPLDEFSTRNFSFTAVWQSIVVGSYWVYDKLLSVKEEISYRLNPTPYRYTPVSSIPRPSFEYDDFDD
jgi:hypothetical protein